MQNVSIINVPEYIVLHCIGEGEKKEYRFKIIFDKTINAYNFSYSWVYILGSKHKFVCMFKHTIKKEYRSTFHRVVRGCIHLIQFTFERNSL